MQKKLSKLLPVLVTLLIVGGGIFVYTQGYFSPNEEIIQPYDGIEDEHVAFVAESYDIIQKEYWEVQTDEQLSEIFRLAYNFLTKEEEILTTKDRFGVQTLIQTHLENKTDEEKKKLVTEIVHVVLQNLRPAGRSALYTTQKETELRNTVANVNPEKNLYEDLGVENNADTEEVENAYEERIKELEGDTSEEAEQEREKVTYAKEVLSNEAQKEQYDETGSEPTVFARVISNNTVHLKIQQFSPYTFDEFIRLSDSLTDESLTTLVLDLRGNIGGAVDYLPYFLGPFIGPNQYAYDFLHQDEYNPHKTAVGWLPSLEKYKRVIILIDNATQSSGEIMAGTLKKYNVGVLVGESTRGWGTIENTFPLTTTLNGDSYSLFLVHSITLRPDGQPIEGRGIDPHITLNDSEWKSKLDAYFNDSDLITTLDELLNS